MPARVSQEEAHRGHRGQARAGIGRGVVEEGRCKHRTCMQMLGLARGLRRCSDVYGNGVVGSVSPARSREQVISRCCGGVPNIQRRSREGEERSTATSSSAVDLPQLR
jgi:hypothetical protein